MTTIRVLRAGPLTTLQDGGRPGYLRYGISASGPMDITSFHRAGGWLGSAGSTAIEFSTAGLAIAVGGEPVAAAADGGSFSLKHNGKPLAWPARLMLRDGDSLDIAPGPQGNYGYLRFDREIEVAPVLGSSATNLVAQLGGLEGRALRSGDHLEFGEQLKPAWAPHPVATPVVEGPIRFLWGLHADLFSEDTRQAFIQSAFRISSRIDRMGARLEDIAGVFRDTAILSLVSDAVVPGDIQVLGDGTPIVLLRDHQPTGGYPRIGTVVSGDIDRLAQLRPGSEVRFEPTTLAKAHGRRRQGQ